MTRRPQISRTHAFRIHCRGEELLQGKVSLWLKPAQTQENASRIGALNPGQLILLAATAGVAEEFIYRGFALGQVVRASGSVWAGGVLSGAFFVLHHRKGWGLAWLLPVALMTAVITAIYLFTGSLWVAMGAHFLTDLLGFLAFRMERVLRDAATR